MAWTRADGWVWVFACIDHYSAEAWAHVAKVGDRLAALQPVDDAVVDRWGRWMPTSPVVCHCGTTRARSTARPHFTGSLAWLGISDDPVFLGEPETNGCAERWIRTLKDQCLWVSCTTPSTSCARPWPASSTATTAPGSSNATGTRTPKEAYQAAQSASAA